MPQRNSSKKKLKDSKIKLKDNRIEKFFDTTFFQAELDEDGIMYVSTTRKGRGIKVRLTVHELIESLNTFKNKIEQHENS